MFRMDEESSQGTMTPPRSPPQSYLESVKEEDDQNDGRIHFHPDAMNDINDDEPLTDRDEDLRSQNSRIPRQKMRAILVRTPANKDEPISSPIEDEFDREPHEPDILITELKEPPLVEGDVEYPDSESDIEDEYKHVTVETVDQDILNESKEWDTDLEIEEDRDEVMQAVRNHDPSGRAQYDKICERMSIIPVSYFTRHILDHEITMRWHGLGPAAAKAIALVLRDNITLEKLNLQGNWMEGDGGAAMARMLEDNDYITELVLSDNKLGTVGATCFCRMLSVNAGLRKLDLSGNKFQDKDAQIFADALENTKYLKELHLARNSFGSDAGEILGPAISANDILEVLDLSWNQIRGKGAIAVAKGIGENVRLKVCDISWNGFGPAGGAAIGEALSSNNSLLEIDISGNRLSADSAIKMARTISSNDTLRTIRMGNNILTTAGAIVLATSINGSDSSELQELDLTDVPVEFEFLRIFEDIKAKKPNFKLTHGPILSSGNTAEDLGKPAVHPHRRKEPVMILDQHIVVNDMRLLEILKKYDPDGGYTVTPEDFVHAVEDLAVPFNKPKLQEAVTRLADDQEAGRIYFGDFIKQREEQLQQVHTARAKTEDQDRRQNSTSNDIISNDNNVNV